MVLKPESINQRLKELDGIIQEFDNFQKGLVVFSLFAQEILGWLDTQLGE